MGQDQKGSGLGLFGTLETLMSPIKGGQNRRFCGLEPGCQKLQEAQNRDEVRNFIFFPPSKDTKGHNWQLAS